MVRFRREQPAAPLASFAWYDRAADVFAEIEEAINLSTAAVVELRSQEAAGNHHEQWEVSGLFAETSYAVIDADRAFDAWRDNWKRECRFA